MSGSRWTVIRDNIVDAIRALPLYDGTPVFKLGIPNDIFLMTERRAIGVCLTEDEWMSIDLGLTDRLDQPAEMTIPIVLYATSEAAPAAALEEPGQLDDLTAMILGTNAGPWRGTGIRGVDVGVPGETGGVYLRAIRTTIIPDQMRAEGAGGALCKVIFFRTTVIAL